MTVLEFLGWLAAFALTGYAVTLLIGLYVCLAYANQNPSPYRKQT